jgi:hypothetical protein
MAPSAGKIQQANGTGALIKGRGEDVLIQATKVGI